MARKAVVAPQPAPKRKRGRPQKPLDVNVLNGLAQIGATKEEMALVLGVDVKTLYNRNYSRLCEKGKALRKVSLRRWQTQAAEGGNVTMQIWLGKQELGQTDKVEALHAGDVKHTYRITFDEAPEGTFGSSTP